MAHSIDLRHKSSGVQVSDNQMISTVYQKHSSLLIRKKMYRGRRLSGGVKLTVGDASPSRKQLQTTAVTITVLR